MATIPPQTYGTKKVSGADITSFIDANQNDPGAIAKGMSDYGVSLDDISNAGGWDRKKVGDYIGASGNDWLKQQYSNWGSPTESKPLDFNGQMSAFTQSLNSLFPSLGQVNTGSISASERAADLIKEGSPLLDLAQSKAAAQANARGLLNSTMATGSGTRALLEEAGRFGQMDANNELSMQQTQLNNQARLRDQVASFGMGMQRDEAQWDRQDARDKVQQDRDDVQRAEDRQWQVADRDAGWARADELDEITFSRNLQAAYTSAVDSVTNQLTADINRVQASELPADVKAAQITALQTTARTQVEFRTTLFESMDGWKSEWAKFVLELPAAAPAPA